jgi:hypothetical protein
MSLFEETLNIVFMKNVFFSRKDYAEVLFSKLGVRFHPEVSLSKLVWPTLVKYIQMTNPLCFDNFSGTSSIRTI